MNSILKEHLKGFIAHCKDNDLEFLVVAAKQESGGLSLEIKTGLKKRDRRSVLDLASLLCRSPHTTLFVLELLEEFEDEIKLLQKLDEKLS